MLLSGTRDDDQLEPPALTEVIRELSSCFEAESAVVFCGAGISRASGLPLAKELVHSLLCRLNASDTEQGIIQGSGLPFESFMQTVLENSEASSKGVLLGVFDGGEPNANHLFLSGLARRGKLRTIVTTNFDTLIERALRCDGVPHEVLHSDQGLLELGARETSVRVVKLHGTADTPESMAVTLAGVASQTLSPPRAEAVRYVFSRGPHSSVFVLGYSCSDAFDLTPAIRAVDGNRKRVLLLDHISAEEAPGIEPIAARSERNPFQDFGHGWRITAQTDIVVAALGGSLLGTEIAPARDVLGPAWQTRIEEWRQRQPEYAPPFIVAKLLARVGEHRLALHRMREFLKHTMKVGDLRREMVARANIAGLLSELGNAHLARRFLERSRELADASETLELPEGVRLPSARVASDEQRIELLRHEAQTHFDQGQVEECWQRLEAARLLLESSQQLTARTKALLQVDLTTTSCALGRLDGARENYDAALAVFGAEGDVHNLVATLGNLSDLLVARGKRVEARQKLEEALAFATQSGDPQARGICTHKLAKLLLDEDPARSVELAGEALRLLERMPGPQRVYVVLALGTALCRSGDLAAAATRLQEAKAIAQEHALKSVEQRVNEAWVELGRALVLGALASPSASTSSRRGSVSRWKHASVTLGVIALLALALIVALSHSGE